MLDLQALTQAVGDLDEVAVEEMIQNFVASNPSREDANQVVAAY